jgi:8-oxo-dGTP diphosphatase
VKEFFNQNGSQVVLTFLQGYFGEEAKHVFVICQYEDKWLLTNHKVRGLEFPGGKCEVGETLEQAARREVYEETGAVLGALNWIGEYKVTDQEGSFVKAVFWGQVKRLEKTNTYFETNGPVVMGGDLLKNRFDKEYSFIMKDQVIEECMNHIRTKK